MLPVPAWASTETVSVRPCPDIHLGHLPRLYARYLSSPRAAGQAVTTLWKVQTG